jgi:sugar phosphate permease
MTNVLATLLTFAALPLVRRFGVVKAMVLTHLPSAIFLGLMPLPNSSAAGTWMAMALLSLWGSAQWMDQAPRQAFLVAVVKNEERTAVLGVINIVKTIGQAGGIGIAGIFAQKKLWVIMLSGAGLMKVVYDVLIICTFLGVKDREDEERERKEEVTRV